MTSNYSSNILESFPVICAKSGLCIESSKMHKEKEQTKIYLFLLHVTANVEEVGRVPAVQLDDVHGGHGQAGPVDQTANVAVHLHVVKVVLGCLNLTRLGLRCVLRRRGIKNVIL